MRNEHQSLLFCLLLPGCLHIALEHGQYHLPFPLFFGCGRGECRPELAVFPQEVSLRLQLERLLDAPVLAGPSALLDGGLPLDIRPAQCGLGSLHELPLVALCRMCSCPDDRRSGPLSPGSV